MRRFTSQTIFPNDKWIEATPEEVGIKSENLNEAVNFLAQNSGRSSVHKLMIVRHGRLIYKGDRINEVHPVWSCTKSFTSTVLGLLIDDNKTQLSILAKDILPEMAESYPTVTLFHFATMTSGYTAEGDAVIIGGETHGHSLTPYSPDPVPLFAPGTKFAYWDSAENQFANILTQIAKEPLDAVFKNRIADPIGMNGNKWHWGDFGKVNDLKVVGGAGNLDHSINISANEIARFALLFLNEGNWNGNQIISRNWIKQATKVQVPPTLELGTHLSETHGMGVYGLNWWVNGVRPNGIRLWPDAPANTYAASGHNNNKVFIIPEWDMVIVRLGLDAEVLVAGDGKISEDTWSEFLGKIGDSDIAPM
ncbi:MAG: serine hydrolase [Verrucomicrobia bacterium]|nr:serine hydrolase [Verrucomicrobiota bacterium]MDA1068571.1 serine hydrolase [Verrucomicrobiota bacterium]